MAIQQQPAYGVKRMGRKGSPALANGGNGSGLMPIIPGKACPIPRTIIAGLVATSTVIIAIPAMAQVQQSKPNIVLIVSDDFGYGDSGPYGGGEGRGMPTPSLDRLSSEGMTFYDFYAQPSCTPGRAAIQTGRIPNRSG